MKLRVVPSVPDNFRQYGEWCRAREQQPQAVFARAREHIWVDSPDRLVLGVALFDSPGFLMAEFMVSNPEASLLERYRAALLAADVFVSAASTRGLMPLVHTSSRGVARILERKGFKLQPFATLLRDGTLQVSYKEKVKAPPKPSRRRGPRKRNKRT